MFTNRKRITDRKKMGRNTVKEKHGERETKRMEGRDRKRFVEEEREREKKHVRMCSTRDPNTSSRPPLFPSWLCQQGPTDKHEPLA